MFPVWAFFPGALLALWGGLPGSHGANTYADPLDEGSLKVLSSGAMDYDFEAETVQAQGPVKASYGPYRMEAGILVWDRGKGLVKIDEGVQVDNSGQRFEQDPALGKGDFFEAWWPESYATVPFVITAESARLEGEGERIEAVGRTSARFPYGRLNADSLRVSGGEDASVRAEEVRTGSGTFLIGAGTVSGNEEEVILENAGIFLAEPGDWGPRIYADRIRHGAGDEQISLYGVTLGMGPVPILYLPRGWLRDWDLGISFDLGGGFSDKLGIYGDFGVSFKATSSLRLSPAVSYFSRRGWMLSPNFSWNRTSDSGEYYTDGSVLAGHITDQGSTGLRGVDRFGNPIGTSRGYALARGLGNQRGGWSFVNQFEARSDTEVLRDFRPGLEGRFFAPESFSEILVPMGPFSFTALGRFRTMDMTESLEAIPSISLILEPAHLGATPLVHSGWVDFSRLERADYDGRNQASATRWEGAYRWSYTLPTSSWLTITPVTGVRERVYQDVRESGEDGSSTLFEIGFDAGADFHREWPVRSEIWNIDGLIHQSRPLLGYRWMPQSGMDEGAIPRIHPNVYASGVNPLGFAGLAYRSENGPEQVLRLGWENRFLAGAYGDSSALRHLGSVSVYQDILEQRPGIRGGLPSNTMLAVSAEPAPWVELELFSRVATESMTLIELVPGLSLRDGDRWESSWYFQSLQHQVNQLLWEAEVALDRNNSILFEMRYNGQNQQITKQAYGWRHRLGNAWLLDATMIFRRGDEREGNFQVNFGLTSLLF